MESIEPRAGDAPDRRRHGVIAGLMAEVVEDQVRTHLTHGETYPGALEQLLEVARTYLTQGA